mmetsp:Transcript_112361/g.195133  ORF Transcript_112361/g.195133 Transcript_112361/m.195133 type:complete len:99 (+) Transcript_112361:273-569(+)
MINLKETSKPGPDPNQCGAATFMPCSHSGLRALPFALNPEPGPLVGLCVLVGFYGIVHGKSLQPITPSAEPQLQPKLLGQWTGMKKYTRGMKSGLSRL